MARSRAEVFWVVEDRWGKLWVTNSYWALRLDVASRLRHLPTEIGVWQAGKPSERAIPNIDLALRRQTRGRDFVTVEPVAVDGKQVTDVNRVGTVVDVWRRSDGGAVWLDTRYRKAVLGRLPAGLQAVQHRARRRGDGAGVVGDGVVFLLAGQPVGLAMPIVIPVDRYDALTEAKAVA